MNLAGLLRQTITVQERTGFNANGDPSFAAVTTIKARVERDRGLTDSGDGVQRSGSHVIASTTEIKSDMRVWLDGDDTTDTTKSRQVVRIEQAETPDGQKLYQTEVR